MAASDNTTYMGIALVGGASQEVQIGDKGQIHQTITNMGADNAFHMTINDGTTTSSGYCQGLYINLNTTTLASWSGGQINPVAIDYFIGGTVGVETTGLYIYIDKTSSPTVTSAEVSGETIYLMDLGGTPSYQACLRLFKNTTNLGVTDDSFIFCVNQGSGNTTSLIGLGGTNHPSYFLTTHSAAGSGKMIQTGVTPDQIGAVLVCMINGSTMWIPLYTPSA